MAEFTSAEKVNIGYENEYSTDAMTGGPDKRRQLYYQLIQSMKKAESVDIIVSFLMESGVRMLLKELEHTLKRGAKIRILTGNYLGITQPSALYLIKRKLGDRVDLRFYCEKGRSFHPKSYIFHYTDLHRLFQYFQECADLRNRMELSVQQSEGPGKLQRVLSYI